MYRQRSKPAAAPAEVRIPPLSTKSTPASTSTSGYRRESSLAAAQCVVAQTVQKTGGGQGESADADRGDPGSSLRSSPQRLQHVIGYRRRRIGQPRNDDRVGTCQRIEAVGGTQSESASVYLITWGADAHRVSHPPVRQPGTTEDLERRRKVKGQYPIKRQNRHRMHGNIDTL